MTTYLSKKPTRPVRGRPSTRFPRSPGLQQDPLQEAKAVIAEQSEAIARMAFRLDEQYLKSIDLLLETRGRVVVLGMGKSGLIGQNMVSTFASTGTPAMFVHPAEARHGDLGMIQPGDVVVMISYSGETEEVVQLIPYLRSQHVPIIALVGETQSTLALGADAVLDISVEREVCPNNLAPTASVATTLAMANSLAVSLMNARAFTASDFAALHPGGSLGRRLLTRVKDAMRTSPVPVVEPHKTVQESLFTISQGRLGLVLIMADGELQGIVTDGDLRRALEVHDDLRQVKIEEIMTRNPITISETARLCDAEKLMKRRKVTALVVVDAQKHVCGIVGLFDGESTVFAHPTPTSSRLATMRSH